MKKEIKIDLPDYLTLDQYSRMSQYEGDTKFGRLVHVVSSLTEIPEETVKNWPVDTIIEIAEDFSSIADHKQEFHSIIEWNGILYGYCPIRKATLGEYIDLETYSKDLENNLNKVAAILYRPIVKHKFKSLKFAVKQKIKMLDNDVENVFDWYTVEDYDVEKRKEREEEFKQFPAHIFLGALGFFLSTASLYINAIAYSAGKMEEKEMISKQNQILRNLSESTGAGGGLSTLSVNPTYLRLQATGPLQTSIT